MLTESTDYVIGVDTHAERHAFCLVEARSGRVLDACELPASRRGYRAALRFARRGGRGEAAAATAPRFASPAAAGAAAGSGRSRAAAATASG